MKEARITQVVKDVKLLPNAAAARPAALSDQVRDGTAVRAGVESRAELTFTGCDPGVTWCKYHFQLCRVAPEISI
jgi:hypothetical protein